MAKSKDLPPTTLDELRRNLERLKLLAMLEHLDEALEQASSLEQGYVTFLAGLVEKQVLSHTDAAAKRRIDNAGFPKIRPSTPSTGSSRRDSTCSSSRT